MKLLFVVVACCCLLGVLAETPFDPSQSELNEISDTNPEAAMKTHGGFEKEEVERMFPTSLTPPARLDRLTEHERMQLEQQTAPVSVNIERQTWTRPMEVEERPVETPRVALTQVEPTLGLEPQPPATMQQQQPAAVTQQQQKSWDELYQTLNGRQQIQQQAYVPSFPIRVSAVPVTVASGLNHFGYDSSSLLPLLQHSKSVQRAQPVFATPTVTKHYVQQPIMQHRTVTQPIVQRQVIEQPILRTRIVHQPVIHQIVTQPVIQPQLLQTTKIQPQVFQQPILQPRIYEQTIVQPVLEEQFVRNAPIVQAMQHTKQAPKLLPAQFTQGTTETKQPLMEQMPTITNQLEGKFTQPQPQVQYGAVLSTPPISITSHPIVQELSPFRQPMMSKQSQHEQRQQLQLEAPVRMEIPRYEAPRFEAPRVELEAPKYEAPRMEFEAPAPRPVEQPRRVELPKVEQPRPQPPAQPKVEEKPVAESEVVTVKRHAPGAKKEEK